MRELIEQIRCIGLRSNDTVIVHSSFKSIGITNPEIFILALLEVLTDDGTLLMPGLSYQQNPHNIHDVIKTPTCVGFLSEYFRNRQGTVRSIHPTHSVCGIGSTVKQLFDTHIYDSTPCGHNSPFNKLFYQKGKILMVGCGLKPNTSMHAIEEYVQPPYLYGSPKLYTITDTYGNTFNKTYITHNFKGYVQRYDRVINILGADGLKTGSIGNATVYLLDSEILFERSLEVLRRNPFYFVDSDVIE
jgi:aminoglycoside 3-N-acetyltransferase